MIDIRHQLKRPTVIQATYRIVTPMFIGDAEQNATGIAPQSVKGALRFWWRALMWREYASTTSCEAAALVLLHDKEAALFGSASDEDGLTAGQGYFSLRVNFTEKPKTIRVNDLQGAGLSYFLGIGLSREGSRSALAAGQTFQVNLTSFNLKDQQANLIKTLMLFGLVGGLGSRVRKGWGSVAIESLAIGKDVINIPHDKQSYQAWLKTLSNDQTLSQLPPFTAFSNRTRIDISRVATSPTTAQSLLNEVGEEQQLYRSYGLKDFVNGKSAEQNFSEDHDLVANIIRTYKTDKPSAIPKRAIFGLPHNYYFSSTKGKADLTHAEPNKSRRASPLIIHAHQFTDKSVAIVQILMPAVFLPDNALLEYSMGKQDDQKRKIAFQKPMLDWQDITNYLNRFPERETI
jgi:CRISPR-associated protein Cmr1